MLMSFILVASLISIIILLGSALSKKVSYSSEKMSPFECGFTPKYSSRLPFSMRFFLISLIFLVFDIELVLLFPFIHCLNYSNMVYLSLTVSVFLIILLAGLMHEWNQGSLCWTT